MNLKIKKLLKYIYHKNDLWTKKKIYIDIYMDFEKKNKINKNN